MRKNKLLFTFILTGAAACIGMGVSACCPDDVGEICKHTNYTYVAAVEANCTDNGNIAYWHCEDCGKYYSDENAKTEIELDATIILADSTKHNYGTLIEVVAATCQTAGEKAHYHCAACNKDFDEEHNEIDDLTIAIDPDAHDFGEWDYDYENAEYVTTCAYDAEHKGTKAAGEDAEYPYLANSTDSLTAALANGGYIKLTDNVTLDKSLTIGNNVTLDLNEKKLTHNATSSSSISAEKTFEVSNGTYELNVTGSSSNLQGFYVYGSLILSGVDFNANLISTCTRSSQSFYTFYAYNQDAVVTFKDDASLEAAVKSQTNENCAITVYGINANGTTTVNGASIKADTGITLGMNGHVTLKDANIDYTVSGIDMRYNGGNVVIQSGVTFTGELTNPAIIFNSAKTNSQIDDRQSGYNWVLFETIDDCNYDYIKVIENYKSGEVIKQVYTDRDREHTYGTYELDEDWMEYTAKCSVCGREDSVQAGTSEELYYPVKDESGLTNAASNATAYIKLENDITITAGQYDIFQLNDGCVLDLNGHTVTVKNNVGFTFTGDNATIKNGTICRPAGTDYSYGLRIGGNYTIEGITIDSGINVTNNATVTIKNCTITLSGDWSYYQVCAQRNSNVTVENCTMIRTNKGKENSYFWIDEGSSMQVTGCTFKSNCGTNYYIGVKPTGDEPVLGTID